MNGIHDMGGMHGMGPIEYESNEPVFHEPWEARAFALNRAMSAWANGPPMPRVTRSSSFPRPNICG